MRQLGFGVVAIIGVSPDKAQAGDITVELMHNGFCMRAQVKVKCKMEQEDGFQAQDSRNNIILPPTLRKVSMHHSKRQRQMP